MTREEHQLIIMVLARQAMVIRALSDALVANKTLGQDDVPAFGAYLDSQTQVPVEITKQTENLYKVCAKVLGLETGL